MWHQMEKIDHRATCGEVRVKDNKAFLFSMPIKWFPAELCPSHSCLSLLIFLLTLSVHLIIQSELFRRIINSIPTHTDTSSDANKSSVEMNFHLLCSMFIESSAQHWQQEKGRYKNVRVTHFNHPQTLLSLSCGRWMEEEAIETTPFSFSFPIVFCWANGGANVNTCDRCPAERKRTDTPSSIGKQWNVPRATEKNMYQISKRSCSSCIPGTHVIPTRNTLVEPTWQQRVAWLYPSLIECKTLFASREGRRWFSMIASLFFMEIDLNRFVSMNISECEIRSVNISRQKGERERCEDCVIRWIRLIDCESYSNFFVSARMNVRDAIIAVRSIDFLKLILIDRCERERERVLC